MLTLDDVRIVAKANVVYTGNRPAISLFQLKDVDAKHTAPALVKIDDNLFTLRNMPNAKSLSPADIRAVATAFEAGYGWDVEEPVYFRILPEIVESNDTLRRWVTHRYYTDDTGESKGLYVVVFRSPKTPIDVKAFMLKAFMAIQAQLGGEMNQFNRELVKKVLQKEL